MGVKIYKITSVLHLMCCKISWYFLLVNVEKVWPTYYIVNILHIILDCVVLYCIIVLHCIVCIVWTLKRDPVETTLNYTENMGYINQFVYYWLLLSFSIRLLLLPSLLLLLWLYYHYHYYYILLSSSNLLHDDYNYYYNSYYYYYYCWYYEISLNTRCNKL